MAQAFAKVQIPVDYQGKGLERPTEPLMVERAFALANPGLRPDMIAVGCGRSDNGSTVLREVRICLTRDLRNFRPCPDEVERGTCRARSIMVPEVR
jgi:ribonuclease T2